MASAASPAQHLATATARPEITRHPEASGLCTTAPFFNARIEVGPVSVTGQAAPTVSTSEGTDVNEQLDEHGQDVGNVVLLEHINLEVPDLEVARLFFGEGLGLTADPATTGPQRGGLHVVWYNCGKQQFHIVRGPGPQCLPPGAVVGLVMPDVGAVAERLEAVRQLLGDVSVTYARSDTLKVVDPYGNTFAVHSSLPYFSGRQGIAYLQLPCFRGTAPRIARFYSARMGARCRVSGRSCSSGGGTVGESGSSGGNNSSAVGSFRGGAVRAEVWMGPGQKLVFVEQSQLGPLSDQAVTSLFGGWHIAMYVADFSSTFKAVHHPNRPPFNEHPYRDKYRSLRDALQNRQFRFQDIVATREELAGMTGAGAGMDGSESRFGSGSHADVGEMLLYRISHEVRSLHHPLYGRPLYGRETGFA